MKLKVPDNFVKVIAQYGNIDEDSLIDDGSYIGIKKTDLFSLIQRAEKRGAVLLFQNSHPKSYTTSDLLEWLEDLLTECQKNQQFLIKK